MSQAELLAAGTTWNGASVCSLYRSSPPSDPNHWQRCPACTSPMRWDMAACTGAGRHEAPAHRPILYASRTGTRRNLAEMAAHGYRLLATPNQQYGEPMPPWAFGLDNGAWTAHTQGLDFDENAYRRAVDLLGPMADWVVAPDIVCGGLDSLALSVEWLPELLAGGRIRGPVLVPVQDGMSVADVEAVIPLGRRVGLFVGGSTDWKEQTMSTWAALAREAGAWCHVGRVNTVRRLVMVTTAGADSCDGTSVTKYAVNAPRLAHAAAQHALPLFGGAPR